MSPLPVEQEKELSLGGFQGIQKIRGLLIGIDVQDPPDTWDNAEKQVVRVDMEDTTILEMFGDEEVFDLKEGKFNFFMTYAVAGKKPHANSVYSKCWLASAKELGKLPSEFIGQYVTLGKQPRLLFQKPVMEDDGTGKKSVVLDEEGKKVLEDILAVDEAGRANHYCFVADETADADSVKKKVRDLILGLNEKAALRKLLTQMKRYPEYKDMHKAGSLAKELGLVVLDGKYAEAESA